jgi:hypothetical protein
MVALASGCSRTSSEEITSKPGLDHGGGDASPGAAADASPPIDAAVLAGTDAGAGASRDAGAGDASRPAGSPEDALNCYRYIRAHCERSAECRNLPVVAEGCLQSAADCGLYAGNGLTPNENLEACVDDYATFDCDHLLRGRGLECVGPGQLAAGEPCSLSLSCQSLSCRSRPGEGLSCAERVELGAACPEGTVCSPGESCVNGRCEPSPAPNLTNGNWPLGGPGEVCFDPHQCQEGLLCLFDETDTDGYGACATPPGAMQACALSRDYDWAAPLPVACDSESYCDEGTCLDLPGAGQPCVASRFLDQRPCEWKTFCDADTERCLPWLAVGESCMPSSRRSGLSGLPLDPPCDPTDGARCSCPEGQAECDPDERRCLRRVEPGRACTEPFSRCVLGSRCVDGTCSY